MMAKFIGSKIIMARPMSRADYNTYRGWELPADEDGNDAGMLVEYVDGGKSNHPEHKGYISWSPMDVFDRAYRPFDTGMDIGRAVSLMKSGFKVARKGWNGKGMFLYYVPAADYEAMTPAAQKEFGATVPYAAYVAMKTATGEVVPWHTSQSDLLANDWVVVD